jgi:hypothetical protein
MEYLGPNDSNCKIGGQLQQLCAGDLHFLAEVYHGERVLVLPHQAHLQAGLVQHQVIQEHLPGIVQAECVQDGHALDHQQIHRY